MQKRAGKVAQEVEHLPSKYEALKKLMNKKFNHGGDEFKYDIFDTW
jgi:hypothetical protein